MWGVFSLFTVHCACVGVCVCVCVCVCVPCVRVQFIISAFGHGCHSTVAVVHVNIVAIYNDICDQYILDLSKTMMSWYLTWMVVLISICFPLLVEPVYLHYFVCCKGYL